MFKPLTRSARTPHRPNAGFAETQFLHSAGEDDYSGFAPTELFDQDDAQPMAAPLRASPADAWSAASTSHSALERAASAPQVLHAAAPAVTEEALIPQSWATSQWVAAQEAKAHEAADQARAVIAAQRRAEERAGAGTTPAFAVSRTGGFARLRSAFERLLPGLLPLFIGVTVTMALISAVLPLFDKP